MLFSSALVTQASGTIGGLVASHNAGGKYLRAAATPTNPNTPRQGFVRFALGFCAVLWRVQLDQAQRDAWAVYAENVTVTNRLGNTINLSGFGQYVRANSARIGVGLVAIDDAPTEYDTGLATAPTPAFAGGGPTISVAFDNTDPWANVDGGAMILQWSRPQNDTINYLSTGYRFGSTILGSTTSAPTSPVVVPLPFPVTIGQKLFSRARATQGDARLGQEFLAVGVIEP